MKQLVVGLGNPGAEYHATRHNAGFLFVDYLQQQLRLQPFSFKKKLQAELSVNQFLILIKPTTYMNLSGLAVKQVIDYYLGDLTPSDEDGFGAKLMIAHDDLDLELGEFKIQKGVGPHDHHGLQSIYQQLHTSDFWHIRIGVDDRAGARSVPTDKYVLQSLTSTQLLVWSEVFDQVLASLHQQRLLDNSYSSNEN
jgi:PTH1 family peptidyl-tRNA hydrolase